MSRMKRMAESAGWHFDGATYDPVQDKARLGKQAQAVWETMTVWDNMYPVAGVEFKWWTLAELENSTGYPQSSISARLRDFRKPRFGSHTVERRRRKDGKGTWEYRLRVNEDG